MNRYFFHLEDGQTALDTEGIEFLDLRAAHDEAVRASDELLRDRTRSLFEIGAPWRFWITDGPADTGKTLLTIQFVASK